jgi:hypothetical protein
MATTPVKPDKQKDVEKRERIVKRIAREMQDGFYVNLELVCQRWWPITLLPAWK